MGHQLYFLYDTNHNGKEFKTNLAFFYGQISLIGLPFAASGGIKRQNLILIRKI